MKHLVVLSLVVISVTALFGPVNAQTSVDVCKIELSDSFSVITGKVARVGNTLVFVDDDLGRSFSVDRSNIKSLSMQEKIYSIYTKNPVNYRGRDRLHFDFTLDPASGNCDAIGRWLRQGINASGNARPPGSGPKPKPQPPIRKYPVVHTRDLARDFSGTLIVSEKTIEFECPQDSGRSRRWALKDIRKVEQRTPYLLMVFPCTTDKYTFEFPAKGMEISVFKALRNRISRASDCK